MSTKGSITTSNHIEYDKALNIAKRIMNTKDKNFGFFVIVSINTGLRVGDILELTKSDFINGYKKFREQKTNKSKKVVFNDTIIKYFDKLNVRGEYVFISQKKVVFSRQQINIKLKKYFTTKGKNISSHSLRKSFGRRVYENNGESEKALVTLSQIFNHSSIAITRTYLDITQEEIQDVYLNL